MICRNCGCENQNNASFCSSCGMPLKPQGTPQNTAQSFVLKLLTDDLYTKICILMTVSAGVSVLSGNLPLIRILFAVFLWCIYEKSRKGIVDHRQMTNVSGTIYASYILTWVGIAVSLLAIVIAVLTIFVASAGGLFTVFSNSVFSDIDVGYSLGSFIGWGALTGIMAVLAVIRTVLTIIAEIVINLFGRKKLHLFAKSLYESAASGELVLSHQMEARRWLFVMGVITAVLALFNLPGIFSAASYGCYAAVLILASKLLDKYSEYDEIPQPEEDNETSGSLLSDDIFPSDEV